MLGCHDLNFVQPRTKARGVRAKRAQAIRTAAQAFKPAAILQNPHKTDTSATWRNAWSKLNELVPHVTHASGIAYFRDREVLRQDIDSVRLGTAIGNVVDYIGSGAGKISVKSASHNA